MSENHSHTTARIICVGNRYAPCDGAGPAVHDHLVRQGVPDGVEVLDGGLLGLSLLRSIEGARRVVFVDQVEGFAAPGEVIVLRGRQLAAMPPPQFGHANGLAFLLHAIPVALDCKSPDVVLVGIEGTEAPQASVAQAAALALDWALAAPEPG